MSAPYDHEICGKIKVEYVGIRSPLEGAKWPDWLNEKKLWKFEGERFIVTQQFECTFLTGRSYRRVNEQI
jgi:hypothetical protein